MMTTGLSWLGLEISELEVFAPKRALNVVGCLKDVGKIAVKDTVSCSICSCVYEAGFS